MTTTNRFQVLRKEKGKGPNVFQMNFPQLSKMGTKTKETEKGHFLEVVQDQQSLEKKNEKYLAEQKELQGWVKITSSFHKIQITPLATTILNPTPTPTVPSNEAKSVLPVNAVVKLYEERKRLYIDNWGEEEYDHMFRFPNHKPIASDTESDSGESENEL